MRALVLITGMVAFVRDLVLCAGVDLCNSVLCFLFRCLCFVFVESSTLGSNGVDNWGI